MADVLLRFSVANLIVNQVIDSGLAPADKMKTLADLELNITLMHKLGLTSLKPVVEMTADDLVY
jgi:hypothetical protein